LRGVTASLQLPLPHYNCNCFTAEDAEKTPEANPSRPERDVFVDCRSVRFDAPL